MSEQQRQDQIYGITQGEIVPLNKVKDPIFSEEMMGKGIAMKPSLGEVYAPFDGYVVSVFPTKHAITLKSEQGCEVLIHVGIDTVNLNGELLEPLVSENDKVKTGEIIMRFDLEQIKARGYDTVIPVVILNTPDYETIQSTNEKTGDKTTSLLSMEKAEELLPKKTDTQPEYALEQAIISTLGGKENISSIGHCATRLRVNLKDEATVDGQKLGNISGVLGIVKSMGGIQIVIGNNVNQVYANIQKLYNIENSIDDNQEKISIPNRILNVLSDILSPAVPLIMASGFISAILVILTRLGMDQESSTYIILNAAANVVFYFLPVVLAYTASKRFKCNTIYALFIGGLLLHPNILGFAQKGGSVDLFHLPVTAVDYSSSLLPIILSVWILSYVEKLADRYVPNAAKYVFKPFVIVVIMLPIVLCLTGPAGFLLGKAVGSLLTLIYTHASWLAILLVASLAPFLVMTGMHIALTPIIILSNFENLGYDNMLLIAFIGMNFSQFAVVLAVMFKTKKSSLKQLAASCALTAFLSGITEPTLYGISVKLKKPFYATFIGCIANGIFCAIANVKIFSFAPPSFFTLPIFMNPDGTNTNFILALCTIGITIVVTFIATWILGFDDSVFETES